MKCHPEHLTSEFASLAGLGAREMVNASRHTFNLLSDPLQRFSNAPGGSEEVNIDPELFCFASGATHSYCWAAFFPATYPATAPPTAPTTADVTTTPQGQTGHDANNAAKRLICVLLPQS